MSKEAVNHPKHYGGGDNPYEAIKVIEAWDLGFCLGNTVKYICRAGKKEGEAPIQDLKKAQWYLTRRLQELDPSLIPPVIRTSGENKGKCRHHVFIEGCADKCGVCNYCNLSICSQCGLYEGGMTTHCPGDPVSMEKSEAIYAGKLNYRSGCWVNEVSEHSPAFHRHYAKERCTCPIPKVGPIINDQIICGNCFLAQALIPAVTAVTMKTDGPCACESPVQLAYAPFICGNCHRVITQDKIKKLNEAKADKPLTETTER